MAGGQERVLRRRIRSVQSTKKITRAMELIAASRIVRAQSRIAGAAPYLKGIAEVLAEAAADAGQHGRPGARGARVAPARPASWPSWPTGACAAATTPTCCAPPSARCAPSEADGRRSTGS